MPLVVQYSCPRTRLAVQVCKFRAARLIGLALRKAAIHSVPVAASLLLHGQAAAIMAARSIVRRPLLSCPRPAGRTVQPLVAVCRRQATHSALLVSKPGACPRSVPLGAQTAAGRIAVLQRRNALLAHLEA